MISILQNNINKWKVGEESALLITSPYYSVGSSTLSKKLANQNNALLIQIDTLRNFLRISRFHFKEASGLNIDELEEKLKNNQIELTGEYDTFAQKDDVLTCIQFIKETQQEIYDKLSNDINFGDKVYTIKQSEFDKYDYDSKIFNDYIDWLLKKFRKGNKLVVIDGVVLLKRLSEDDELLNNAPVIIIDSDKLRVYFNAMKGISTQAKSAQPNKSMISIYCSLLWKMFKQRKESYEIMNRGELYKKYIERNSNLYNSDNPNLINNLKYSTDYDF